MESLGRLHYFTPLNFIYFFIALFAAFKIFKEKEIGRGRVFLTVVCAVGALVFLFMPQEAFRVYYGVLTGQF